MSRDSAFLINHELKRNGLASLEEAGALLSQLAYFVRDHAHLKALLNACEPEERQNMYDALEPNLRFRPKPLADYMIELAQDAERRQLPIVTPEGGLKPFNVPELKSDAAIATRAVQESFSKAHLAVVCAVCTREDVFHGITKEDAVKTLRAAGWRGAVKHPSRMGLLAHGEQDEDVEVCPQCVRLRAPRMRAA